MNEVMGGIRLQAVASPTLQRVEDAMETADPRIMQAVLRSIIESVTVCEYGEIVIKEVDLAYRLGRAEIKH